MHHADPLFEDDRSPRVSLDKRLVSHEECAHELQDRNFDREVEGCDHTNGTKWPPVGCVKLTSMITWLSDRMSQESNTVATEVLDKVDCHSELGGRLGMALGSHSLDTSDEKFENLRIVHALYHLAVDLAKHEISLLILKGVVKASLGA